MDALDTIPYQFPGATFTSDALRVMRNDIFSEDRGDRASATNVAVLITGKHVVMTSSQRRRPFTS